MSEGRELPDGQWSEANSEANSEHDAAKSPEAAGSWEEETLWRERDGAMSVFDWEGEPDPGCPHPWYRLDFVEDNQGLGCSLCGRAWFLADEEDAQEALLVSWQSSRLAFEQLERRHQSLVAEISGLLGKFPCAACDMWFSAEKLVELAGKKCCPEHVGEVVARLGGEPDTEDAAADLLSDASANDTLSSHWLVERNITSWAPLQSILGRSDETFPELAVSVDETTAQALEVEPSTTIRRLVDALATALELPQPVTRPAMVFLLGLTAESQKSSAGRRGSAEVLEAAFPENRTHRAVIVIDLCRDDVPGAVSFTGDLADDLVRMIGARAIEFLSS